MLFFNKSAKRVFSSVFCLLIVASIAFGSRAEDRESLSVTVSDVDVRCSSYASATAAISDSDRIFATVDFECPETWVLLSFSAENNGGEAVRLTGISEDNGLPAGFSSSSDLSNDSVGKVLSAGQKKTVSVLVRAEDFSEQGAVSGSFSLTLSFEAAYLSPDTGDFGIFPFATVCAICAVLLMSVFGKMLCAGEKISISEDKR